MQRVNRNRIIITGATGFIGRSLMAVFLNHSYVVLGLSRKYTKSPIPNIKSIRYNSSEITQIINKFKPNVLINAAGSASVEKSFINPQEDFHNSVNLVNILLEGIRRSFFKPLFVQLSSASVYKTKNNLPINETTTISPISPYSYHKIICDLAAKEYSYLFGVPVLIVRLFSVFGPNQRRLLLWEIYNKFANKNSKSVIIDGTGEESRDYLYIDDFSYLLAHILNKVNSPCTVLNIASGKSYKVKDIVNMIKTILKSNKPIIFKGHPQTGKPKNWQADISALKKLINIRELDLDFESKLRKCVKTWNKLI